MKDTKVGTKDRKVGRKVGSMKIDRKDKRNNWEKNLESNTSSCCPRNKEMSKWKKDRNKQQRDMCK